MIPTDSPVFHAAPPAGFQVRTDPRPDDIGTVVARHVDLYARECGFDASFEQYVADPLARFLRLAGDRDRLWIAERAGAFSGCIAIVDADESVAQLRWFLVEPAFRGSGLGRWLLAEALTFARLAGYGSVVLWTVSILPAAAHLYRSAGFRKVEEKPGQWGTQVIEEKYTLDLLPHRQGWHSV
jgi:GNAT superfamily N-acetyltransferase